MSIVSSSSESMLPSDSVCEEREHTANYCHHQPTDEEVRQDHVTPFALFRRFHTSFTPACMTPETTLSCGRFIACQRSNSSQMAAWLCEHVAQRSFCASSQCE